MNIHLLLPHNRYHQSLRFGKLEIRHNRKTDTDYLVLDSTTEPGVLYYHGKRVGVNAVLRETETTGPFYQIPPQDMMDTLQGLALFDLDDSMEIEKAKAFKQFKQAFFYIFRRYPILDRPSTDDPSEFLKVQGQTYILGDPEPPEEDMAIDAPQIPPPIAAEEVKAKKHKSKHKPKPTQPPPTSAPPEPQASTPAETPQARKPKMRKIRRSDQPQAPSPLVEQQQRLPLTSVPPPPPKQTLGEWLLGKLWGFAAKLAGQIRENEKLAQKLDKQADRQKRKRK